MKKKAVMVCLVNRCMRDPHVQWCESLSPSPTGGGAGYSIRRMCFVAIDIVHLLIIDLYNLLVSKEWSSKRIVYKPKPNSISTFPHHISRSTFHINRIALWVCCCHNPFV